MSGIPAARWYPFPAEPSMAKNSETTMSDADRLREAADRLDERVAASARFTEWAVANKVGGIIGPQDIRDDLETAATAALLRAVAEEGDHDERISGFQLWPNTYDAALALADVILGVTDE